ncbi:MAG: hypothetical protein JWN48_1956 [Myxococcaceae bacterium]|nr:hypothetical protein [Myxococcaceae bacterium]
MEAMPVRTRRWNDPAGADDGLRLLICRYRPRGVPSAAEPWDAWSTALAPSKALHAAAYGKDGSPRLPFEEYERRFRLEMEASRFWIEGFARNLRDGQTITLLCSSACVDEARCHRSIVKQLLEQALEPAPTAQGSVHKRASR